MKKIFSLIAAVLFAGSMMATTVSQTVENLAAAKSWENGVVVTPFALDDVITISTTATDANTGKYYTNGQQIRLYQTGAASLTVTAAEGATISSITLTYASQNGGILVEAASETAVSFENVQSATFTIGNSGDATNGQVRITAIAVTYDGGDVPPVEETCNWDEIEFLGNGSGNEAYTNRFKVCAGDPAPTSIVNIQAPAWADEPGIYVTFPSAAFGAISLDEAQYAIDGAGMVLYVSAFLYDAETEVTVVCQDVTYTLTIKNANPETPVLPEPTNCAEAAEAALSVSANNELYNNGAVYTIEGYVTGIKTAYSSQYNNISFWMADAVDGGEVLQAYRAACASEADAPAVGDKVAVTGSLTKYNTTPEFAAGCTFVITEPATPVVADTYTVAGSDAAIFGEAWNPALEANDMVLDNGIYTWEKAELNLTVGMIEFKVVKNHSWDIAYPASNYELSIAEDGEYTITITFDPATEAVAAEAVKQEPLADPTNCAEAAAAALSVENNNDLYNDGAVYTIEGYVTSIKTAYSDQYHNISFWMADAIDGGEVLQAYRAACESEADAPVVGDKVAVTGSLTKYNTTPEFAAGCTFVITEHAAPADKYYVVGSMTGWNVNEDYELTPDNGGLYKGEFTFAANDEFKVVKNDKETWYPGGQNNNYVVTEAGDYKITFNPAGNVEGWYEGFFNVIKKEAPAAISCLDIYQMAKNDVVDLLNDVVVTYANGKNVWVKDETASMLIYLSANTTWNAGDVLSGVAGVVDVYNGIHEIKPSADQVAAVVATPGEAPAPEVVATVTADDVNKYIVMKGVAAEGAFEEGTQSNLTINGITVRNQFKNGYTFEAGKVYNIYGVVTLYQNNPQVYFITAESAEGIDNTNVELKATKAIENGQLIIIKNGVRYDARGNRL